MALGTSFLYLERILQIKWCLCHGKAVQILQDPPRERVLRCFAAYKQFTLRYFCISGHLRGDGGPEHQRPEGDAQLHLPRPLRRHVRHHGGQQCQQ